MDDALNTDEQRVARETGDASPETLGPEGDGERVVVARDLTRRYGSGDAAVDALRGASVDLLAASSRPSWVPRDRASPPSCTSSPASTRRRAARSGSTG